jgi:hypothetical protein
MKLFPPRRLIGVFIACFFSFVEYLPTGERGTVLILVVDKAQAKVVFNYRKGIIEAIPALRLAFCFIVIQARGSVLACTVFPCGDSDLSVNIRPKNDRTFGHVLRLTLRARVIIFFAS